MKKKSWKDRKGSFKRPTACWCWSISLRMDNYGISYLRCRNVLLTIVSLHYLVFGRVLPACRRVFTLPLLLIIGVKQLLKPNHNFFWPSFQTSKISEPPYAWKVWVKLIENHINSILPGKFVAIFSTVPLRRVEILRVPFCIQASPTSVCEWSLIDLALTWRLF